MDPIEIIKKYFEPRSPAFEVLIEHGRCVMEKALKIALQVPHLGPDTDLIMEASMLHDIGIIFVNAPQIGCHGHKPYICHGYLGRELIEKEGYPLHALICERHIGTGITVEDIDTRGLPLPRRQMVPVSAEERIICYADKFFSKNKGSLSREKTVEEVRTELMKFGPEHLRQFDFMHQLFSSKP